MDDGYLMGGGEMALKDFMGGRGEQVEGRTTEAMRPTPPAPAVQRPARTVSPNTCIDATSELKGTLRCRETLRIDGRIEGEIHCEKNVIVGEAASIRAAIDAAEVAIAGEVKGDITASRKITLEPTARVVGDLCTPGIVIEEGAKLEGRIMIGADEKGEAERTAREQTRAQEKPSPKPSAKTPPPPSASV
jgi:cytoskeletal protein CcmA (bactofilin family)